MESEQRHGDDPEVEDIIPELIAPGESIENHISEVIGASIAINRSSPSPHDEMDIDNQEKENLDADSGHPKVEIRNGFVSTMGQGNRNGSEDLESNNESLICDEQFRHEPASHPKGVLANESNIKQEKPLINFPNNTTEKEPLSSNAEEKDTVSTEKEEVASLSDTKSLTSSYEKIPSGFDPSETSHTKDSHKTNHKLLILSEDLHDRHFEDFIRRLRMSKEHSITLCHMLEFGNHVEVTENTSMHFFLEYNEKFVDNTRSFRAFFEEKREIISKVQSIGYHVKFDSSKNWPEDYAVEERDSYNEYLEGLAEVAGKKVSQCSLIHKNLSSSKEKDSDVINNSLSEELSRWSDLKILDFYEDNIYVNENIKFPDTLEILNIKGGISSDALEKLKIPPKLVNLTVCQGSFSTIDNVTFPKFMEELDLSDNKIYFLNYVEFPQGLQNLVLNNNCIDNLRGVNFPRSLRSLSLSSNPIECIKGVKFPEELQYLDVSCIPNESMAGIKFPDSILYLNLQESMTNTRGLKLPQFLKEVNLSDNGVNSINPLKLPNTIEKLFLSNNNIKTLNKANFPSCLKELYLGNNLVTTLKNVHFPEGLEYLDLEMDPELDENDRHITTLKDVILPSSLKVIKLGYHAIKSIESVEFPFALECLSLAYNELRFLRNLKFGPHLKILDLSGNNELLNIDHFIIPESIVDLRIPSQLVNHLPGYIVERANKKLLKVSKSAP